MAVNTAATSFVTYEKQLTDVLHSHDLDNRSSVTISISDDNIDAKQFSQLIADGIETRRLRLPLYCN